MVTVCPPGTVTSVVPAAATATAGTAGGGANGVTVPWVASGAVSRSVQMLPTTARSNRWTVFPISNRLTATRLSNPTETASPTVEFVAAPTSASTTDARSDREIVSVASRTKLWICVPFVLGASTAERISVTSSRSVSVQATALTIATTSSLLLARVAPMVPALLVALNCENGSASIRLRPVSVGGRLRDCRDALPTRAHSRFDVQGRSLLLAGAGRARRD